MKGVKLVARTYQPPRPDWDHDHCEFCWTRFSCLETDQTAGYSTEDGYRWVCTQCFDDFREEFGWT